MASPSSISRPFVVILGWLGSQSKHLRRYESLYHGFEVFSRIATPAQVIRALLTRPETLLQSPRTWPYSYTSSSVSSDLMPRTETVDDLAWEILAKMDESNAPVFFLHLFSNGGGLVWESLARIFAASHAFPGPVRQRLNSIESRIAGIVVDSAPALEMDRLFDALAHVPPSDQLRTLLQAEPSWLYLWWRWNSPATMDLLNQRRTAYLNIWMENPVTLRIPTLFFYCENDPLAESKSIDRIVKHLPNAHGICWKDSIHCGHLLRHGDEYTTALNKFVQTHLERPDKFPAHSKL